MRSRLDFAVRDLGATQLKNITEPMRVYSLEVGVEARAKPATQKSAPSSAPRLSIVVLPFSNLSGDTEQEYFVDGVTESLTTDLSRIAGSFVIARNTAFAYQHKPLDLKQIGRELNVRYVLEGSVQRSGSRLRVNVQLIDAESGAHLWAERFDKPVGDLFDMQDEIVGRLANQLGTQLIAVEARRAEQAPHPDFMDLCFQGLAWVNKGLTPDNMDRARDFFERALALDPVNIEALVGTAEARNTIVGNFMTDDPSPHIAAAEMALTKVLSLAPNHAQAHASFGRILMYSNRAARGIVKFEQALALNPNLASAHALIGVAKYFVGRGMESESHIREAFRLSPRDTFAYAWMAVLGVVKLTFGSDEEAVGLLQRAVEANPNYPAAHFWLASALAHLDQLDDARLAIQTGLALDPTFTVSRYRSGAFTSNPTYLARRERIIEGMRKAGVPEG